MDGSASRKREYSIDEDDGGEVNEEKRIDSKQEQSGGGVDIASLYTDKVEDEHELPTPQAAEPKRKRDREEGEAAIEGSVVSGEKPRRMLPPGLDLPLSNVKKQRNVKEDQSPRELPARLDQTLSSSTPPAKEKAVAPASHGRKKEAYSGLDEPGSLPYERHVPNYRPEVELRASNAPCVKEVTERYRVSLDSRVEAQSWLLQEWQPERRLLLDPDRMVNGGFCRTELVQALWKEKCRIDSFFDEKEDQQYYYRARNSVFPQDQKGSKTFRNRAGDKLYEVHDETDLFDSHGKSGVFFDVCGGPGAWSEVLLKDRKKQWTGFGMTLKLPNTPMSDMWYKELEADRRWKSLWGNDGTGNVYNHKNLEHAAAEVTKLGTPVTLVMGDGGFHISTNAEGQHMEHLQELFSVRIILSELLACLKCVTQGVSIIYVTGLCFESVYIVKPYRSRIVNSERYIVGKRLREKAPMLQRLIDHITSIHASWSDEEADGSHPVSLIPAELMMKDAKFKEAIVRENEDLCQKQTLALKQVMDLAEQLRNRDK